VPAAEQSLRHGVHAETRRDAMFTRFAAMTGYVALTAIFLTATILVQPDAPSVSMTSMSIEKTHRLSVGNPDPFVTQRFAG
jgi:hypothetical protein